MCLVPRPVVGHAPVESVDDEQLRTDGRRGAVRFGIIGDLVTHPRRQREDAAIREFGAQLAFETQQDMPFAAPVICEIASRILDHAHADIAELSRTPARETLFTAVFRLVNLRPVGRAEGKCVDLHVYLFSLARIHRVS